MAWLLFVVSAAIITFAAVQLAKYGDVIAIRTGLGGVAVGTLLLGAATSLPEILMLVNALSAGLPGLAVGNLLGSNMFNVLILAIMDLSHPKKRILRKAAMKHALSGVLSILLISMVVFYIGADLPYHVHVGPWAVGLDSVTIIAVYVLAVRQLRRESRYQPLPDEPEELPPGLPGLWPAVIGFASSAALLVIVTPWLVSASDEIAKITGVGTTFIGTTLVAMVTSIPELVTTLSAVRIGADDMAIGNVFGSNMFNMLLIGVADLLLYSGQFIGAIDNAFMLVGMLGLIMSVLAVVGNLARLERRIWFIEIDAALLILIYFSGMALLYIRGLTG